MAKKTKGKSKPARPAPKKKPAKAAPARKPAAKKPAAKKPAKKAPAKGKATVKKAAKKASPKTAKKAAKKVAKKIAKKALPVRKASAKTARPKAKKAAKAPARAKPAAVKKKAVKAPKAAKPALKRKAAPAKSKASSAPVKAPPKKAPPPAPIRKGPGGKKAPMARGRGAGRAAAIVPVPVPKRAQAKPAGRRPLDGLTVLDLTDHLAGPAAGLMLANFGATVIKIEHPSHGDPAREAEPLVEGIGAAFRLLNRGKRSLALDISSKKGREAYLKLAATADVILDDARPGRRDRAGAGYKQIQKLNPGVIYIALSGYGLTGPYAKNAGSDINYMAMAGALELLGGDSGLPAMPGMQLADFAGGALPAVIGLLLALLARGQTGDGQLVDVAAYDGLVGLLAAPLANYAATRRKPRYGQEPLFGQYACYNIYPARNSRWLAVGALEPRNWALLCKTLGREDLVEDQFADGDRQQVLVAELTRVFQKKEVREWLEEFAEADVCVTEVRDIAHAGHDEHLIEREVIIPERHPSGGVFTQLGVYPKLSQTPGAIGDVAPVLGRDTRAILESSGLAKKTIDDLFRSKTAREPKE